MPGPEVAVNPLAPFQLAPIAIPIAANSSSACTLAKRFLPVLFSILNFLAYFSYPSARDVEGVIGYHEQKVAPP